MFYSKIHQYQKISIKVVHLQCILFVILWTVWPLPHTTALRNTCLVCGALLGAYQILRFRNEFSLRKCWPPLLAVGIFFAWVHFHLLFLSNNWILQWNEYLSVWKSSALSFIFGIGFAFSLSTDSSRRINLWLLLGLSISILVYFVKWFSSNFFAHYFYVPEYLLLFKGSAPYYVPKISYVFFLIPILVVFLVLIFRFIAGKSKIHNLRQACFLSLQIIGLISIFLIFILENIKNGVLYSFILTAIFMVKYFYSGRRESSNGLKVLLLIVLSSVTMLAINIEQNSSWKYFFADLRVAINVDQLSNWRDSSIPLPVNEDGVTVSGTNYDRISWGIVGMRLLMENPLGYGLIDRSFSHLAKKVWPDTSLVQSHSGWLDFSLGVGIPGLILVMLAFLLGLKACREAPELWKDMILWIAFGVILLFITTEVSQNIYVEGLFLILGALIGFGARDNRIQSFT